ncbi:MAG: hypothetical protein GF390_02570, partial [Candidatus Pacebacteria bacterium]|nr:hypothetical protein [Candidatus Paceibacterota bacterium]
MRLAHAARCFPAECPYGYTPASTCDPACSGQRVCCEQDPTAPTYTPTPYLINPSGGPNDCDEWTDCSDNCYKFGDCGTCEKKGCELDSNGFCIPYCEPKCEGDTDCEVICNPCGNSLWCADDSLSPSSTPGGGGDTPTNPPSPTCNSISMLDNASGNVITDDSSLVPNQNVVKFQCAGNPMDLLTRSEFQVKLPDGSIVSGAAINPSTGHVSLPFPINS